jgi:N6-adenosine-specific RNA methylase IME4
MQYKKHRFNIYPEMQPEEFERLRGNLLANGYDSKHPIWLFEGEIIDGWNRYRACDALGIPPVVRNFEGSEIDAMQFAIRTNDRRDLSSSQRAAIAIEAEELVGVLKAEAARRQAEFKGNQYTSGVPQLIAEVQTPRENKEVRTQLAQTFGTNRQYVSDAAKIKAENPEAFEAIKAGAKTITEVKKEAKIEERRNYIERQKQDIETGNLPELQGLFDVISIDPPWPYGREYDPEGSRVANPYPEMSIEQIKGIELSIKGNAVIFLWTTHAFLPDSFDILKTWGATYKATMVWNKQKIGMGAWFRMQCEFCLVGIIGKPFWSNTRYPEIIEESRREHSRKPDSFFALVDNICAGRKLEYFSREARQGWEIFGNDINKFI